MTQSNNHFIRLLTKADLEPLAALYATTFNQISSDEHWTKQTALQLLTHCWSAQPDLCFMALANNQPVGGFLACIKPWCDGNHLVDGEIFVAQAYQQQHIGAQLSGLMYQTALDKYQIVSIDLVTFGHTNHPLAWYQKLGFELDQQLVMINGEPKKVLKKLVEDYSV